MATLIVSFGFRHGVPDTDSRDKVLDVRQIMSRNPFKDKKLRHLRGDNELVIADLEQTPNLEESYNQIKAQALECEDTFYVGCTGGHHRSVYIANRLAEDLGVDVVHLNYSDK
jgi:UPF0042 nucleotide-binding protein